MLRIPSSSSPPLANQRPNITVPTEDTRQTHLAEAIHYSEAWFNNLLAPSPTYNEQAEAEQSAPQNMDSRTINFIDSSREGAVHAMYWLPNQNKFQTLSDKGEGTWEPVMINNALTLNIFKSWQWVGLMPNPTQLS